MCSGPLRSCGRKARGVSPFVSLPGAWRSPSSGQGVEGDGLPCRTTALQPALSSARRRGTVMQVSPSGSGVES